MEKVLRDRGALRDEWVMQEMGVDERTYYETLELSSRNYMASLDEVLSLEDGDVSLEGILSDGRDGAAELLEWEEELEQIVDALRRLPEREAQVLSLYCEVATPGGAVGGVGHAPRLLGPRQGGRAGAGRLSTSR